jgi:predicted aminopeptidase
MQYHTQTGCIRNVFRRFAISKREQQVWKTSMAMKWRSVLVTVLVGGFAALAGGCAQVGYYVQAAQGEYALLADAKPIDEWLATPTTSEKLKVKLEKVRQIRKFAVQELSLPDNGTFKTYTDLKRPFVLWNVVATPELSLKPTKWCFPIAGCVDYRGYYNKNDAQAFATELRHEGLDVQVAGVPAYSTLGWFNDPVLSTFIQYPDAELARMIFHELAHQMAYAPGDTQFNESFATTVEEVGVERWLVAQGDDHMRQAYMKYESRKQDFLKLLMKYRKQLEDNYARNASVADKRKQKAAIFQALKDDYQVLKVSWGGYAGYDRWFAEPLSNAHLASIANYHDFVPSFRALLVREKSFPRFYEAVKKLASLDKETRHRQLTFLAIQPSPITAQSGGPSLSNATSDAIK